jgi:hypothetical protein
MAAFFPLDLRLDVAGSAANLARAQGQIDTFEAAFLEAAADAQMVAAQKVYDRSQVLVPVETGALKASGKVVEFGAPVGRGMETVGVMVQYGGGPETSQYAVIVHEDLEAHHEPPTQAKYLQTAVDEIAPQMGTLVGEGIVRATQAAKL